jgi:hypothetical protein
MLHLQAPPVLFPDMFTRQGKTYREFMNKGESNPPVLFWDIVSDGRAKVGMDVAISGMSLSGCLIMTANVRMLRRPTAASRRRKVDWPARCGSTENPASCRILDISQDGARVSGLAKPSRDNSVLLFFEHGSPVSATIVWRDKDRAGLRFHQQQVWIQDNNERRFDAAAWMR